MDYKQHIAGMIQVPGADKDFIAAAIEIPPTKEVGDFALPCFKFANDLAQKPRYDCKRACPPPLREMR